MIVISWKRNDPLMVAFGRNILCSCPVRNELNGLRDFTEIVYTMPDHKPYYPRQFPCGTWIIGEIVPKPDDRLMNPFLIKTDAQQLVDVWETRNGLYLRNTKQKVMDTGYDLHMLNASETWGCIGVKLYADFIWLIDRIRKNITSHSMLQIKVWED